MLVASVALGVWLGDVGWSNAVWRVVLVLTVTAAFSAWLVLSGLIALPSFCQNSDEHTEFFTPFGKVSLAFHGRKRSFNFQR